MPSQRSRSNSHRLLNRYRLYSVRKQTRVARPEVSLQLLKLRTKVYELYTGWGWVGGGRKGGKRGSWAMWWFMVSSGGLKWWTQESETRRERRVGQRQQHSRRKIGAGELWCTSLRREKRKRGKCERGKDKIFTGKGMKYDFICRWGAQPSSMGSNCPIRYRPAPLV